jgi:polyisoprenoid-binding protein YceI
VDAAEHAPRRERKVIEKDRRTVWQIDPTHTTVEFAVTNVGITTIKGRFTGVSGTIRAAETDLANASVAVEIDAASLDTSDGPRDAHLRDSEFLDVERFPTLTFNSTRVEPVGPDRLRVHGDLTIRGTSSQVVLDTRVNGRARNYYGFEVVGFSAETRIRRQDFGLTWNHRGEAGDVLVGDTVRINLEIQVIRQD